MKRYLVTACIAAALCGPVLGPMTAISTSAQTHAGKHFRSAQSTVDAYFGVLNHGMSTGDFSALKSVYAPNATLTKSGTDGKTAVYHGLSAITDFYHGLYAKIPNWQWTTDELRPLNKGIVLAYEHAGSPPLTVASRCIHVFVIKKGLISNYDWAAFYPGK
ncbi:MAG: hypothetical protein NVSMB52_02530 [Chloroflexota bacterium]